jgi:outer membrane receptor protein involved in Fe transport
VRSAQTESGGNYSFTNLLPGLWVVKANSAGFAAFEQKVTVTVGARVGLDIHLAVGKTETTVQVTESAVEVNTETQTLGTVVTQSQIRELPNLTRNPYQFVELAGNVSEGGIGTRGAGFAINGQREASTNILLDGGSNNDEYNGNIGQQIPLDAVGEFSVLTSNFGAEYGRASGGIVNVASKSGSNEFHGTAYEFNRVSHLSSNSFENNALGIPESVFTRNQFGYSFGGPIKKNKLFFFSSTEWTRVRSNGEVVAWVPTSDLIGQTPANVQAFFNAYGQLRSSTTVLGTVSRNDLTNILGSDPCASLGCASLPMTTPLFTHVGYSTPTDSGGGAPQNTWDTFNRIDYNLSDKTQIYGRYALYSERDQAGFLSNSPYANYDLGQTFYNHNFLASVIHTFSSTLTSQSKIVFNRLTNLQTGTTPQRGVVPTMYANVAGAVNIGADSIAFPGYNPYTPGAGGAFGGPQNIGQLYEDMSWVHGTHTLRFGGTFEYLRDNRTYAAYQTAVDGLSGDSSLGGALSAMLAGQYNDILVAVNPQGKFPCAVNPNDCNVTLPVSSPDFSRSNRYKEEALYVQDAWKLKPRLTLNLGVRWEHFGVQHNVNPNLDSNFYAPGIGLADSVLGQYINTGTMQLAPKSSIGQLWKPDWKDFAPRVGVAWDVFGDGKTSLRGGYGIGYERNFGNVTFNMIQNPPSYAVLDVSGPVSNDNFGPLAGNSGTLPLPTVGARIVDPNIKTAYAHTWSASLEHEFGRSAVVAVEYSGSKGVNLYTIAYPNQPGFGNMILGMPCNSDNTCTSPLNSAWGAGVGYRGNQGFSIYHSLNTRVTLRNFENVGLDLTANYTWSHAIDNMSSTFFESAAAGLYSNNITVNNGWFVVGLENPFNANMDRGNAEFDLPQRFNFSGSWRIPAPVHSTALSYLLKGWSINPLFTAHSGTPFSVFDTSVQSQAYITPRATFNGAVPTTGNGLVASPSTPNTFAYLTFPTASISHVQMTYAPGTGFSPMSGRDAFRGPGWWNLDAGVYKDTKLGERVTLQIRGEVFNLFNHANFYVTGSSADVGVGNTVNGCYGCTGSTYDRRNMQLAAKVTF